MPIPKKPTAKQKTAAQALQTPSQNRKVPPPPPKAQHPVQATSLKLKPKRLAQAGIVSGDLNWIKAGHLFNEDESPKAFFILNARATNGTFGEQVVFKLQVSGESEASFISFTLNSEREDYVTHFRRDTAPLGPCCLTVLPLVGEAVYYKITDYDDEIPF